MYMNGLHDNAKAFLSGFALSDLRANQNLLVNDLNAMIARLDVERSEENDRYKEALTSTYEQLAFTAFERVGRNSEERIPPNVS
jgi:hypothetical protein